MLRNFVSSARLTCSRRFCATSASMSKTADAGKKEEDTNVLRARLLYQSRKRGILENDIIIGEFATRHLGELTRDELRAYDEIINGEYMEWDLYYYCVGRKPAPDALARCAVFRRICAFARSPSAR